MHRWGGSQAFPSVITVFSAPNYCGEFDNAGAMMSVDDSLMCSFQILKPAEKRQRVLQASEAANMSRVSTPPAWGGRK